MENSDSSSWIIILPIVGIFVVIGLIIAAYIWYRKHQPIVGPTGNTGTGPTHYLTDLILNTTTTCPAGYSLIQSFGAAANGTVNNSTTATPPLYLCGSYSTDATQALTDINVDTNVLGSCIQGYTGLSYSVNGQTSTNITNGCGNSLYQTAICKTNETDIPIVDVYINSPTISGPGARCGADQEVPYFCPSVSLLQNCGGQTNLGCNGPLTTLCVIRGGSNINPLPTN